MSEAATTLRTRQRLIEAAGALFAERGFDGTTVRAICHEAGTNVAAVNYHFGGKDGLHAAIVNHVFGMLRETFPVGGAAAERLPLRGRLELLIRAGLMRRFDPDRPAWHGALMSRERMNPRPETLLIVGELHEEATAEILAIVKSVLGARAPKDIVNRSIASVMSQVLFYMHGGSACPGDKSPPFMPKGELTLKEIDRIVEHVTEFSLSGLSRIKARCARKGHGR
jgi:AcrR family transcriptional regulator